MADGSIRRKNRGRLLDAWARQNDTRITERSSQAKQNRQALSDDLRIPEPEFWPLMHYYKLMSKDELAPDLEQIEKHVDRGDWDARALDVRVEEKPWWTHDAGFFRPNYENTHALAPASGILHRLYQRCFNDPSKTNHFWWQSGQLPEELLIFDRFSFEDLVQREQPFVTTLQPRALHVQISTVNTWPALFEAEGTYALAQTVKEHDVYLRTARPVVDNKPIIRITGARADLHHIPFTAHAAYATTASALAIRRNGQEQRSGTLKLNQPQGAGPLVVNNLDDEVYELANNNVTSATVHPIRTLLPPPTVAAALDYGAVWSGCLGPSARAALPLDQLTAHCLANGLPMELAMFFFESADGAREVSAEEYIRFMSWFAAHPQGLGVGLSHLLALYTDLSSASAPFSVRGREQDLTSSAVGTYSLRLSTTTPGGLVVEVVTAPRVVTLVRVRVAFHHGQGGTRVLYALDGQQHAGQGGEEAWQGILSRVAGLAGLTLEGLEPIARRPVQTTFIYQPIHASAPVAPAFSTEHVAHISAVPVPSVLPHGPMMMMGAATPFSSVDFPLEWLGDNGSEGGSLAGQLLELDDDDEDDMAQPHAEAEENVESQSARKRPRL